MLQVGAIGVARLAGKRQVGLEAIASLLHVGSLVARAGVEVATVPA